MAFSLGRKPFDQPRAQRGFAAWEVEAGVAQEHAVVDRAHVGPREPHVGDLVEQRAQQATRLHVADVVHADVPFVAGAAEDVGEAADRVVAFEDQHAAPAMASEQRRGGEAADARADDDRIVRLAYRVALIGLSYPRRRHARLPEQPAYRRRRGEIFASCREVVPTCGKYPW